MVQRLGLPAGQYSSFSATAEDRRPRAAFDHGAHGVHAGAAGAARCRLAGAGAGCMRFTGTRHPGCCWGPVVARPLSRARQACRYRSLPGPRRDGRPGCSRSWRWPCPKGCTTSIMAMWSCADMARGRDKVIGQRPPSRRHRRPARGTGARRGLPPRIRWCRHPTRASCLYIQNGGG